MSKRIQGFNRKDIVTLDNTRGMGFSFWRNNVILTRFFLQFFICTCFNLYFSFRTMRDYSEYIQILFTLFLFLILISSVSISHQVISFFTDFSLNILSFPNFVRIHHIFYREVYKTYNFR